MIPFDRFLSLVASAFAMHLSLLAQNPIVLATVNGFTAGEALASQNALAGLGDIDADGVPDFVAGAPSWALPHPTIPGATISGVGKARVFSGATMSQLFEVSGTYNLQALGKSVANLGDLNGDGRNDFGVGAPMFGPTVPGATPPPPQVQVWSSGGAGSLLYTITSGAGGFSSSNFGVAIAGIGDVGSVVASVYAPVPDGFPDILVGASAGNAAAVYSGATGAFMYSMSATTLNPPLPAPPLFTGADDFGGNLAAAGDVTGDGMPDLLVCARQNALGGAVGTLYAGAVFLLSGAGGGLIQVLAGGPGDGFGQSAARIGDVNGDLVPDFAIGATRTDTGGTDTGSVTLFSGATRAPLWTTNGLLATEAFGYSLSPAGDVNGDAIPDVLVGTPTTDIGATNTGSATLLDGATGARLGDVNGLAASDLLGRSLSPFGDADGDGIPEVLVAAPSADIGFSGSGTVSIVSFGPYLRACAAGSIPAVGGGTFDLVRINGSAGGIPRRVDVLLFQPITISFTQPPAFAAPAPLYAFALIGVPGAADEVALAPALTLCFAPPILNPLDPRLFLFSNSFVASDPSALLPSTPAGSFSLPIPSGLGTPVRVALTGVTADLGTFSVANTVLLNVR